MASALATVGIGMIAQSLFSKKDKGVSGDERALQKEQQAALDKKNAEEEANKKARSKITAAAQSRRGVGTLFRKSGEAGVKLGEGEKVSA